MKLQDKKGTGPELITVVYIFHKKLLYLPFYNDILSLPFG